MTSAEAAYEAAIPPWCGEPTLPGHINMMLCWSLVGYAERGEAKPESTCRGCELYQPVRSSSQLELSADDSGARP